MNTSILTPLTREVFLSEDYYYVILCDGQPIAVNDNEVSSKKAILSLAETELDRLRLNTNIWTVYDLVKSEDRVTVTRQDLGYIINGYPYKVIEFSLKKVSQAHWIPLPPKPPAQEKEQESTPNQEVNEKSDETYETQVKLTPEPVEKVKS